MAENDAEEEVMSVIAGLQDFRQEGPPADIGTFQFPAGVMVFQHVFAGTTYVCALRAGERGWVLVDYGTVPQTVINNAFADLTAGRTWPERVCVLGDYTLTAAIEVPSYIILEIYGRLFVQAATSINAITNDDHDAGNTNIKIHYGLIDGNEANQADGGSLLNQNGVYFVRVADSEVYGMEITECMYSGVALVRSTNVKVHHNYLHENNNCGFLGLLLNHTNTIHHNRVYSNHAAGIKFDGDDGHCDHNNILDNTCRANYDEQIWILRDIDDTIISRNRCSEGTTETQAGILIDGCDHTIIDHNKCWGNTGEGIVLEVGLGVGCTFTIIDHNECWNNDRAGILIAGDATHDQVDVIIDGNICIDNNTDNEDWAEIHVDYSDHITITGNRCRDVTAAWHPIHIDHSDRGIVVANNCDALINIVNSTNMESAHNQEAA